MKENKGKILDMIRMTVHAVAPGAKIILFGSQARGDANTTSDWDILVILDKSSDSRSDYDKITDPLYDLGWLTDEHFSAMVYSKQEWERRKFTPFYKNIEKEGIVI
jgi:predicted nucleotidyltransferase